MTRGENIILTVWIAFCAGWLAWCDYRIVGLETRVNLLESRIHRQEEPLTICNGRVGPNGECLYK